MANSKYVVPTVQITQWADTMPSNHWVLIDDSYIVCWLPNSTDNGGKSYRHPNFRDAETWGGRYTLIDKTVFFAKIWKFSSLYFSFNILPSTHFHVNICISTLNNFGYHFLSLCSIDWTYSPKLYFEVRWVFPFLFRIVDNDAKTTFKDK